MANAKLVAHGTVGGVKIYADIGRVEHGAPVKVRLSAIYSMTHDPGMPSRPCFTGTASTALDFPRDIPSGTVLTLLKHEADALVAAGAAAYV